MICLCLGSGVIRVLRYFKWPGKDERGYLDGWRIVSKPCWCSEAKVQSEKAGESA